MTSMVQLSSFSVVPGVENTRSPESKFFCTSISNVWQFGSANDAGIYGAGVTRAEVSFWNIWMLFEERIDTKTPSSRIS